MLLWMRNPDCNTFQHLCHWIMILVSPNFCRTSILLRQPLSNKFVHHVRSLLLVLFEFVFAFAYRYQQRNGCPISLFLCKIIASATFGRRHSFRTADSCSTASCIFLFIEGRMEDPFLKIRGKVCGECTTRFWQDVAEASLLTGCRPDFPGTRRTAVSLLPQLVYSPKAHAWSEIRTVLL